MQSPKPVAHSHLYRAGTIANCSICGALRVAHGADKYWPEQWHRISWHQDNVRDLYAGQALTDSGQLVIELDAFFIAAWHLWDWLLNDDVEAGTVTERQLRSFYKRSVPLQRCNAYANTVKHFELRNPERLRSRVVTYEREPNGAGKVTLEFRSSINEPQTIDALELVENVVDAWVEFIDLHGLQGW